MNLSCPQCGLQLAMVGPRHEYCPRCIAKRDQPVPLVASSLFKRESVQSDAAGASDTFAASTPSIGALRGRHAF